MYRYKSAALQLSWMPSWMLDMCPVLPEIANVPKLNVNLIPIDGSYLHPRKGKTYRGIPIDNGVILISDQALYPHSVLAHEFRHHWQYYNTWNPESKKVDTSFVDFIFEPFKAYLDYYRLQSHEFDALCFECRVAPNEDNVEGLKVVLEYFNE